jgi:restriction endonuclease S subunit
VDIGTPIITVEHLGENRIVHSNLPQVSDEDKSRLSKYVLKAGDIVFSRVGSVDRRALVQPAEDGWLFSGRCLRVRPNTELLDAQWLSYFFGLPAFKDYIRGIAVGATMPSINTKILSEVPVYFPAIETQRAAGSMLARIDDRIALLRETNATLEAIAQALFKSWFVDFDPVRARMEGRAPEGMDEATAALFPDGFEDSALGAVPRGWRVCSFTDAVNVIGGGTPKTSIPEYWGGDIPWFSVVDAPSGTDTFVVDTEKHITEAGLKNCSTKLLPAGTTIISARGTVGRLALVGRCMAMNQSCYGLRSKAGDAYFTYFTTCRLVDSLKQRSHGSVFDTITRETLASVSVVHPAEEVIDTFEVLIAPVMERIKQNLMQAQTLATLRDTLLPRLISGQLRLPEDHSQVEEATA